MISSENPISLQVFNVVTKNRRHLRRDTFKKRQKYVHNGKNLRKIFSLIKMF